MHKLKRGVVIVIRMLLLLAAPQFTFSQATAQGSSAESNEDAHGEKLPAAKVDNGDRVPEPVITYRGVVYPWQCDHMGHMNVMWYVSKFDEASWQFLSMLGLRRSGFGKEGIAMAAVEQRLEYKHELYAGDLITVRSAILEVRNKTIRMTHEMTNDSTGELAAKATVIGVHMDAALRKAQPLPQDVRERAVLMFAEGAQGCRCLQPADHI